MSRRALVTRRERARAAIAAVAVNAFLGIAFVTGLALREEQRTADSLATFDVVLPPPPPPAVEELKPDQARSEPEGAAGREASAVVAPPTPIDRPTPVVAAPVPASGMAASTGNADRGSGPGAGGAGSGSGGGGSGAVPVARAEMIRGMIADRDNSGGRHVGRVVVELSIAADGRVSSCQLIAGSGDPATDALTCRLSYRILFRPARLASGQTVPDHTTYVVTWRSR